MTINIDRDETESLKLALASLVHDRRVVERFGGTVTVRHSLAIDDLRNLIYRAERPTKERWPAIGLGAGLRSW